MRKRERRIVLGLLIVALIASGVWGLSRIVKLRPAGSDTLSAEAPGEGVGRVPAVVRYLGAPVAGEIGTADRIVTYTEGDAPVPEWYRPEEPMSAEWYAPSEPGAGEFGFMTGAGESWRQVEKINSEAGSGDFDEFPAEPDQVAEEPQMIINAEPHPPAGIDAGGIDWNLCSTLWGWDGHRMEVWEMDAFSRIAYLEFWGTSRACCEAGVDAILQLWDSGYFAPTMYGTLSAEAENGAPVFSTWEAVWATDYDPAGLAEMRELCEARFYNGPEYEAEFFRTDYYHPWAVPCYQIDNVYFSTGKGWN